VILATAVPLLAQPAASLLVVANVALLPQLMATPTPGMYKLVSTLRIV
jgi:hypothetical protein